MGWSDRRRGYDAGKRSRDFETGFKRGKRNNDRLGLALVFATIVAYALGCSWADTGGSRHPLFWGFVGVCCLWISP